MITEKDFEDFKKGIEINQISKDDEEINKAFEKLNLKCFTSEIIDNVDHIAISKSYIENRKINIEIWNEDKVLSDHIGICITL